VYVLEKFEYDHSLKTDRRDLECLNLRPFVRTFTIARSNFEAFAVQYQERTIRQEINRENNHSNPKESGTKPAEHLTLRAHPGASNDKQRAQKQISKAFCFGCPKCLSGLHASLANARRNARDGRACDSTRRDRTDHRVHAVVRRRGCTAEADVHRTICPRRQSYGCLPYCALSSTLSFSLNPNGLDFFTLEEKSKAPDRANRDENEKRSY